MLGVGFSEKGNFAENARWSRYKKAHLTNISGGAGTRKIQY